MAGLMLNGSMIQGLVYNGNPVSAMYNGQLIWPTASPLPTYEKAYLVINWDKYSPLSFAGMSANGEAAPFDSVCYAGERFSYSSDAWSPSWIPINSTDMETICNTTDSVDVSLEHSAKFYFSGNPSSGWKSISWKTTPYYQSTGNVTAQVWGSASNFQRIMGSGTFVINSDTTYTIQLA